MSPPAPKGASGGHEVSASRAAQASEARLSPIMAELCPNNCVA